MKLGSVAVVAALLWSGSAWGEAARMTGKFAADHREAAMLRSLGIDRFSGQDGRQLEMAVERALSQPDIDGRPHFELIGAYGDGDPDGVLSGAVTTGVEESRYKEKQKKCVERDAKDKCLREAEVPVDCTRRVINLTADLRLVRRSDGRIVYSAEKPMRDEASWCRGKGPPRTVEEAVRGMIMDVAQRVRREIAPRVEDYSVRFRESTSSLPKPLARPFREIVKQTQRDLPAACRAWTAMDAQAPGNASIVYDLALCAEAAEDMASALALYRRAEPLIGRGPNEATSGVQRVASRIAAREDDAVRSRRP